MKNNFRNAFSLIETMVALVILAIIVSLVSRVQFSSVYRLSYMHNLLRHTMRIKKELLVTMYAKKLNEKPVTIEDEKEGVTLRFFVEPVTLQTHDGQEIESLKKIVARATWSCWQERQDTALGCFWFCPEEQHAQE